MKRRNFIKKSLFAAGGTILAPLFINSDSKAKPSVKLNYKPEPDKWNNNELTLSWIGHSTVLINFFGKRILTDPVLFERIGLYFFGDRMETVKRKAKYNRKLPLLIEKGENGWYVVECPLFSGCYTQGKTIDEAIANIREVIELILEEKDAQKILRNYNPQEISLHTITM